MTNTNYANEMVNLAIDMNTSIDELIDYCYKQFGVTDIMSLDPEMFVMLQKTMKFTKMAKDYMFTSAKMMQQFDQQLTSINKKMDELLSK